MTTSPKLHSYQEAMVSDIHALIDGGNRRILCVLPTGAGKTLVAADVIAKAVQHNRRVLFLAHRSELVRQASHKLSAAGVDHGIIQAGIRRRPGERVQVASIQSLHARYVRTSTCEMPAADLIIIDEAHHARARTYTRIVERYPDAVVIGLTATPCRGDGRGLGNV
jgi:DNA repair protein RadD